MNVIYCTKYLCFGELECFFLVMVQATHTITVPTCSTRSPMTAPSALVGMLAIVSFVSEGARQNAGHSTAKPWAHNPLSVMSPQLNVLLVSMVQFTCGPVVLIGFDTAAVNVRIIVLYIEVCVDRMTLPWLGNLSLEQTGPASAWL